MAAQLKMADLTRFSFEISNTNFFSIFINLLELKKIQKFEMADVFKMAEILKIRITSYFNLFRKSCYSSYIQKIQNGGLKKNQKLQIF
jgi:hypothetical protein